MKLVRILVIFALGAACGAVGGGYIGFKVGSTNTAIDRAPVASVVPVQPTKQPEPAPAPAPAPAPTEQAPVEQPAAPAPAPAAPAAPAEAAPAGAEEFVVSANDDSEIAWVGYKTVLGQKLSMEGGFGEFNGKIKVVNNAPDTSSVEVTIDINQIYSESTILTKVLKGEHFFKADEFPTAQFVSSKIEAAPTGGYLVTGNLTMHGTTVGIQFPATIERRDNKVYVASEFTVDRKLWNVGYDSYEDAIVMNEVVISFKILADPA